VLPSTNNLQNYVSCYVLCPRGYSVQLYKCIKHPSVAKLAK
jgi:hypothetical protein